MDGRLIKLPRNQVFASTQLHRPAIFLCLGHKVRPQMREPIIGETINGLPSPKRLKVPEIIGSWLFREKRRHTIQIASAIQVKGCYRSQNHDSQLNYLLNICILVSVKYLTKATQLLQHAFRVTAIACDRKSHLTDHPTKQESICVQVITGALGTRFKSVNTPRHSHYFQATITP